MNKSIGTVLVVAFLFRLTLLVVEMNFFELPDSGKDDRRFERLAWEWTNVNNPPTDQFSESGAGTFVKIGSALYSLFGRVPWLWSFILVVLSTATVYNVYKATYLLWNDRTQAIRIGWFAALFPELAELSAVILREVPIHFFLSLAVISLIKYWKYKKKPHVVLFILYTGLCILFHSALIAVLLGFGMGIFLISQEGKKKSTATKVFVFALVAGGLLVVNYTGFGLSKFGGSFESAFDTFESSEAHSVLGTAGYPEWMKMRNGITDIWKLPIRYVAFLFSPVVPFMIKKASHLAGIIDAGMYILMAWSYYKNRKTIKENKSAYLILIISMTLAFVFSLGVSNFGTAIRHRAKLLPLMLVLAVNFKALRKRNYLKQLREQLKAQQATEQDIDLNNVTAH
ncbi:ArnT family glycosyltransferase [Mucilaginibacter conchicola]|nr:hypothetical protein [Mucilaginibacter conchicola]